MKRLLVLVLLFLGVHQSFSQMSGPTPVTVGQTTTYTFQDVVVYASYTWYLSNANGIVTGSNRSGTTYTCTVQWTAPGTSTITFSAYGSPKGSMSVTSNCPSVAQPNPTFSYPNGTSGCGSVVISYSVAPPTGVRWYWQDSPSGTSTANGTNSFTAITGGIKYLRAVCGSTWSTAKSTSTVVVKTIPTVTAADPAICSGDNSNITLTNNLGVTTNTWAVTSSNVSGASNGSIVSGGSSPYSAIVNQTLTATSNVNGTATYTVTPTNNGCTGTALPITVTVKPKPTAAATAQSLFTGTTSSITITNPNNVAGTTYTWTASSSNVSGAYSGSGSAIGQTLTATSTAIGTVTYAITPAASNCSGNVVNVIATVYPSPVVNTVDGNRVIMGNPVVMDGGSTYSTWAWKEINNLSQTLGTSQTYSTIVPGTYQLTVTKTGVLGSGTSSDFSVVDQLSDQNLNYIVSNTMLTEVSDAIQIPSLSVNSVSQTIQYYDDLGRPTQTVTTQGSPAKNDIVFPLVYDSHGKQRFEYLPFTAEKSGRYKPNPIGTPGNYLSSPQYMFYNASDDDVENDAYPYSEVKSESSAQRRPLKNYGPGAAWKAASAGTDKFVENQYLINVLGGPNTEPVIAWVINGSGMPVRSTSSNANVNSGHYTSGRLSIKCTIDEQNHAVREFVNKSGQVILKKVQLQETNPALDNNNHWAQTYYIYDDFGLLRYVFQPELTKALVTSGSNPSQADLDKFAFQYKYDGRNRMTHKKVPGAGTIYLVYDSRDRLVLTQDDNQRRDGAGAITKKEWSFTKFDFFNRPVSAGLYVAGTVLDQAQMQTVVNNYYVNLTASQAWHETYIGTGAGNIHGYDNKSFPQVTDPTKYYAVTYFDKYDAFIGPAGYTYLDESLTDPETSRVQESAANIAASATKAKGLITATLVKNLGSGSMLRSVNYYDSDKRLVQTISAHQKGTITTSNVLDFSGKTLYTKRIYVVNSDTKYVIENPDYDHAGRVKTLKHSMNGAPFVIIAQNRYNELSQLVDKNLHSTDGFSYKQSVDFAYNIRGWMKKINEGDVGSISPGDVTADYFGMDMQYNTNDIGVPYTKAHNGNISALRWSKGNGGVVRKQSYSFVYDAMNRLSDANHYDYQLDPMLTTWEWTSNNNAYSELMQYDLNGNINALMRKGFNGVLIDNLSYTYNGNQLSYVNDAADQSKGFVNVTGTTDYSYDYNGNVDKDANKGLATKGNISYNFLNLTNEVVKGTEKIKHIYNAAGRKLAQEVYNNTTLVKSTDYIGEMVFEGNVLKFIQHAEGRILPDGAGWEYQYHLKDHLGNIRVTFTTKPQTTATVSTNFEAPTNTDFLNYTSHPYDLVDHTDAGTTYTKVQTLNGGVNGRVGLAKTFSVMPGDEVSISAYCKYMAVGGSNPNAFVDQLASAFGVSSGSTGEQLKIYNGLSGFALQVPLGNHTNDDDLEPKAFVTILFFDKDYNLIDAAWDQVTNIGEQTSGSLKQPPHDLVSITARAPEAGYAYVFLSNEDPNYVSVYFDDASVSYTPSPIVAVNDYYPFGLTYNSDTRTGATPQDYKYNGKELQDELGINWLDYGARMYMADVARWTTVDPLSENSITWSPYNYVVNNPMNNIDPDGMDWWGAGADQMAKATDLDGSTDSFYGGIQQSTDPKKIWLDDKQIVTVNKIRRNFNNENEIVSSTVYFTVENNDYYELRDPDSGVLVGHQHVKTVSQHSMTFTLQGLPLFDKNSATAKADRNRFMKNYSHKDAILVVPAGAQGTVTEKTIMYQNNIIAQEVQSQSGQVRTKVYKQTMGELQLKKQGYSEIRDKIWEANSIHNTVMKKYGRFIFYIPVKKKGVQDDNAPHK
jgi:RHS repeat-associated protein